MKDTFKKTYKILSYDLDSKGQLNPVRMIEYFNDTAGSHSESVGYSLESLFRRGYAWILLSWNIMVNQFPRLEENIIIETWISQMKRCFVNREFTLKNRMNRILIRASSRWIFYHTDKKRPARVFPELADGWIINAEKACPLPLITPVFLKQPIYDYKEITHTVQEKDIDILGHVHNSKYIDWMIRIKPDTLYRQYQLKHLQVLYHHEIKYPGEIIIRQQLRSPQKDDKQLVYDILYNPNKQNISTEIATQWAYDTG